MTTSPSSPADPPTDPRALLGRWRLNRRFVDSAAGGLGTMRGSLHLVSEDADQLRWSEDGLLRWGDRELPAHRSYLLRPSVGGWWVHFADGRPFHPWTPGVPVEHPCVDDVYRGLIRVDGPDAWRILWCVTGPRKNQRIISRLTRTEAAPTNTQPSTGETV